MKFVNPVSCVYRAPSFETVQDTVDRQEFRPDAENVRAMRLTGSGGSGSVPLYDYNDGVVPKDDDVTSVIVAMRSGRLDKADIDNIRRSIIADSKSSSAKSHSDKILKAIDSVLGLDSATDSATGSTTGSTIGK